jgi:hypothetical protein
MLDSERQSLLDEEHLRLLRIAYIVAGATNAVFSGFPLIYVALGLFMGSDMASSLPRNPGQPDPRTFGIFFAVFGGVFFLFLVTAAALKLFAARALRLRRHKVLCQVAAAVTCLGIPYGTVLGIFTFQVLGRPSVAALFGAYPPYSILGTTPMPPPMPMPPMSPPPPPPPPAAPNV